MFSYTLLGTGVQRPTPDRQLTSAAVQIDGDTYLFDAPEGIQTSLQNSGVGFSLDAIFATSLRTESLLGLTGLLTTLNTLADAQTAPENLTVYVPANTGAVARVEKFTALANVDSVTVEQVREGEVVVETDTYTIDAIPSHWSTTGASVGYRVREHERPGEFNREKAEDLGIPVGPKFGQLHEGEPVELDDGRVIQPEQVVGDPRPGRTFAYTGATEHFPELSDHVRGVDVLLCDGGITSEDYKRDPVDRHMSAYQAAQTAEAANVSVLIPTHIRGRYGPNADVLKGDLNEAYDGHYMLPRDGMRYNILTRDSKGRAPHISDVLSEE